MLDHGDLSEQPRRPSKESGVDCSTVGKYRVSSFIETATVGGAKAAVPAAAAVAAASGNGGKPRLPCALFEFKTGFYRSRYVNMQLTLSSGKIEAFTRAILRTYACIHSIHVI